MQMTPLSIFSHKCESFLITNLMLLHQRKELQVSLSVHNVL